MAIDDLVREAARLQPGRPALRMGLRAALAVATPMLVASQIGPLRTLQLSLSGRNLFTLTNYSGLDPEVSNFGNQPIGRNYDVAPYPPSRSFWLQISAGI